MQHVFQSAEDKPLEAIYSFPLPRDAALRSFRITGDGFEAHSELKDTAEAVRAYEEGIARGSLSTLDRQYGDGVVNLTVGNIRPKETVTIWLEILAGVELRDDSFRFRFHSRSRRPITPKRKPRSGHRAKARWNFRWPFSVTSSFRVFAKTPPAASNRFRPRCREPARTRRDRLALPYPPSKAGTRPLYTCSASRRKGRAQPRRDLVLDGHFKEIAVQILAGRDINGMGRFAAIVPSSSFGANTAMPRRVVILLDRSGSMAGGPLMQARKAIEACLGALSDTDTFGLLAFDDTVESLHSTLLAVTRENRDKAHAFLERVDARGGTELTKGFLDAAKLLDRAGGDVLILTDGQVAGTEKILADARSAGIRLHCLGIGSVLARETGGVSRFVTPRERVDLSAVDLFACMGRPIASGLKASGSVQPEPPSFVFSGTPVLVFGEAQGSRDSRLEISWQGGHLNLPIVFDGTEIGETVWLLQGSCLITDWEIRYSSAETLAPLGKRNQSRVASQLRMLSQTYGLASREMSLVAVVKRTGDRPGELPKTAVVPVGMPQDTRFDAYLASNVFQQTFSGMTTMANSAPVCATTVTVLLNGVEAHCGADATFKFKADVQQPAAKRD